MTTLLRRLRRRVLKPVTFPQYSPVGLIDPQQYVQVRLTGCGEPLDVTANNVVAALRPLTIGVVIDEPRAAKSIGRQIALEFLDRFDHGRRLGVISMRLTQEIPLPGYRFRLFETRGSANQCLPTLHRGAYRLAERWKARQRQRANPHNFEMAAKDLQALFVFYICPRPVVLVSVVDETSSNIFPMDLIGPTDSPWFTLALRTTSPSVTLMQRSQRLALASIPLAYKPIAYELGKHHRQTGVDWDALPFSMVPSSTYGLPVPEASVRVRELRVEETRQVGSHMLFLTKVVGDVKVPGSGAPTPQLFHVHGAFQQYLRRCGRAFKED